ncbi:hypothetical protein H8959_007835 [Pygathrix nigripes]
MQFVSTRPQPQQLGIQGLGLDSGSWSWAQALPPEEVCHQEPALRGEMAEGMPPMQAQEWDMDARRPMPFQFPPFPDRAPVFPDRMMREPQLPTAEISLWTVVAAIQAVERKVDAQASQLLNLEGRTGTAEKKLADCEKTAVEFGNHMESKWAVLGTLLQEYGLLQRRLENLENLLRNRNFWVLRLPPGSKGEAPKVPVTFVDIAVYFSEDEWKNLDEWQKELYNNLVKENYKTLMSLDAEGPVPKPDAPAHPEPREEPCVWEQRHPEEREISMDPDAGAEPLVAAQDASSQVKREDALCVRGQRGLEERAIPTESITDSPISAQDLLSRIKQEEHQCVWDQQDLADRDIPTDPNSESLISAHDILSWIKQEEQPYPWGPRDSMDGELGLDSGPAIHTLYKTNLVLEEPVWAWRNWQERDRNNSCGSSSAQGEKGQIQMHFESVTHGLLVGPVESRMTPASGSYRTTEKSSYFQTTEISLWTVVACYSGCGEEDGVPGCPATEPGGTHGDS